MTAQFLLVDTCAYLRLASHVHPNFWGGHPQYELRSIAETDPEFSGKRLRSKKVWPNRDPHPALRKKWQLKVTRPQLNEIIASEPQVLEFAEAALEEQIAHRRKFDGAGEAIEFLSPTDLRLLSTAYYFGHGVLTDDYALKLAAREFDLAVVTSLQMLKYLFDLKFVDSAKVDNIMQQWHAGDDLPHLGWVSEFKDFFKRAAPKLLAAAAK